MSGLGGIPKLDIDYANQYRLATEAVPGCVMVAPQILALLVGVRVLPGKLSCPLRLAARTADSQSADRGSIPLGGRAVSYRGAGESRPF